MIIRKGKPTDYNFVHSTWCKSYKGRFLGCPMPIYIHRQPKLVEFLMDKYGWQVLCSEEEEDAIHAWICASDSVLHYIYVPPDLRGRGIAKMLISYVFSDYPEYIRTTHIWPHMTKRFYYDPYILVLGEKP